MLFTDNRAVVIGESSILSADYYLKKCGDVRIANLSHFIAVTSKVSQANALDLFISGRDAAAIFPHIWEPAPSQFISIYIHFTDYIPSKSLFQKMSQLGYRLFSINWQGELNTCTPIPIGIPSRLHSAGKVKQDFIRHLNRQIVREDTAVDRQTDIEFYLNFDITTNMKMRKPLIAMFQGNDDVYFPTTRISAKSHYEAISRSKFVISPPGAGVDCFRTWESIYLGATPIVFRESWPFIHAQLPVMIVDGFEDILRLRNSNSLNEKFPRMRERVQDLLLKFG